MMRASGRSAVRCCASPSIPGDGRENVLADYVNYARPDFERARQANAPASEAPEEYRPFLAFARPGRPTGFRNLEASWTEQREYLTTALKALGQSSLQDEARHVAVGDEAHPAGETAAYARRPLAMPIETAHFTLRFDPATGAIISLLRENQWA